MVQWYPGIHSVVTSYSKMITNATRLSSRESAVGSIHRQDSTCPNLPMTQSENVQVEIFCGRGGGNLDNCFVDITRHAIWITDWAMLFWDYTFKLPGSLYGVRAATGQKPTQKDFLLELQQVHKKQVTTLTFEIIWGIIVIKVIFSTCLQCKLLITK